MKHVTLAENLEEHNKYVQLVDYYDSLIYVAFAVVKERFLGDKKIVEDIYKNYKDWEVIRNEVIELKKAGNEMESAKITREKGAVHVELLFNKTKVLTDYAQSRADEFYQNTVKAEKKSIVLLLFTIALLLLLSIIVSIVVSKSISQPIREFITKINLIYKEKNLPKNKFYNKSEQEILANTAMEIRTVHEKLKNFNRELDQKVEIRTKELSESEDKLSTQNIEYESLNQEYREQLEEYESLNEEYKAQNEELIIAKERAEESDRLKSAFLENMSHEIRTPMNSILGFSDLLKKENLPLEKKEMYIDLIDSGGKKLMTIITDIVEISKINANQVSINYQAFNLNKFIDNLYTHFTRFRTNENVALKLNKALNDGECFIKTDENRLAQILSNLIENAQKFTKEGVIELGYTLNDKMLQFYVKDTGIGIAPEDHQLVFERFRQVDNEYSKFGSGTGLGLAIVEGLVELLKGEIWIESEIDKGTTFYFTIPYKPEVQEITEEDVKNDNALENNAQITILIADDELANYVYFSELFGDYNYNVIYAKNGREAVEIVNTNSTIDIVLMDVKMPVMNGFEATREIRNTNTDIPIIAQTAYAMSHDKLVAKDAGCDDFLTKPISELVLINIIKKYIKKDAEKI